MEKRENSTYRAKLFDVDRQDSRAKSRANEH